jgi:hypothetical protein
MSKLDLEEVEKLTQNYKEKKSVNFIVFENNLKI